MGSHARAGEMNRGVAFRVVEPRGALGRQAIDILRDRSAAPPRAAVSLRAGTERHEHILLTEPPRTAAGKRICPCRLSLGNGCYLPTPGTGHHLHRSATGRIWVSKRRPLCTASRARRKWTSRRLHCIAICHLHSTMLPRSRSYCLQYSAPRLDRSTLRFGKRLHGPQTRRTRWRRTR